MGKVFIHDFLSTKLKAHTAKADNDNNQQAVTDRMKLQGCTKNGSNCTLSISSLNIEKFSQSFSPAANFLQYTGKTRRRLVGYDYID